MSFQKHHCFWFKSFRGSQSEEIHGNGEDFLSHGSQTLKLGSSAHISLCNFLFSNYLSSAIVVVSLTIYSWIPIDSKESPKIHLSRYHTVRRIKGSSVSRMFKRDCSSQGYEPYAYFQHLSLSKVGSLSMELKRAFTPEAVYNLFCEATPGIWGWIH